MHYFKKKTFYKFVYFTTEEPIYKQNVFFLLKIRKAYKLLIKIYTHTPKKILKLINDKNYQI